MNDRRDYKMTTRYILLCRHGPHRNRILTPVKVDGKAVYPTDAIGERLREQLEATPSVPTDMPLGEIWCANTHEAKATLKRLLAALALTPDANMTSATGRSGSSIRINLV